MTEKKNKEKPGKQKPWNEYGYLSHLAAKKEPVILHLNSNTIEDEKELKGVIVHAGTYTLAFLTEDQRQLLVFKHSIRYIQRVKKGG